MHMLLTSPPPLCLLHQVTFGLTTQSSTKRTLWQPELNSTCFNYKLILKIENEYKMSTLLCKLKFLFHHHRVLEYNFHSMALIKWLLYHHWNDALSVSIKKNKKKKTNSLLPPLRTCGSFLFNPRPCFSWAVYWFPGFFSKKVYCFPYFFKRRSPCLHNVAEIFSFPSFHIHFSSWRYCPLWHWLLV